MMAKDYIEYSKKEKFNEQLEYLSKFNLTSHNVKRFEDKIDAIVVSIDTEIRSSMVYVAELQSNINEITSKPEMKGLVDDPWYRVYKMQLNLVKYLIRSGGFKTWLVKFLIVSNNKFSEFLDTINESLVELKKVELQADMYKQMYENLEAIKAAQQHQAPHLVSKEYTEQMELLKGQVTGQQEAMGTLTNQLQSMTAMMRDLQSNQSAINAEAGAIAETSVLEIVSKTEAIAAEDGKDTDEVFDEEISVEDFDDDDSDDDKDDEIIDDDKDTMVIDAAVPLVFDDDSDEESKKNETGIEFDDFDEEVKFFKQFSNELNFTFDKTGDVQFILETADDIEIELGIKREDYTTKKARVNFVGRMAFQWTDYVYTKEALMEFFNCSSSAIVWILKAAGVKDKITWDE